MYHVESLLSARLFLSPQLSSDRIYFLSNISGHISLYAMNYGGSVPEPLLPPGIALQNPHLMSGYSFYVFPKQGKILVMIDSDGDEVYKPMVIPIKGGYPKPVFEDVVYKHRLHLLHCDTEKNLAYFSSESQEKPVQMAVRGNIETGETKLLFESKWGAYVGGVSDDHGQVILLDAYTPGDHVVYLWEKSKEKARLLIGTPLEDRTPDQEVPINSISDVYFTNQNGLIFHTSLFSDKYGLGYTKIDTPDMIKTVEMKGIVHKGEGEFEGLEHTDNQKYVLKFNVDGCSWMYEAVFNEENLTMDVENTICGTGKLAAGVTEDLFYDSHSGRMIFSFSTATSPSQIISIGAEDRQEITQHTNERVLGLSENLLSKGEDASYISFDGTRISARLYLPSGDVKQVEPYPLVYYVHGGPQSQERPDYSWFSMPLIQFLTLKGFAVFVPNVRGSSGYGLSYMKHVDHDWGGKDRMDHVFAMENILSEDSRIDLTRAGVVGRSYGGYMTLTLAGRHPELWSAAVDMFGPYDLLTFSERIPETWKPYFKIALGDPIEDKDFLLERSPRTYLNNISFPLLVIQGKNDPRVVEMESRELVENLRAQGKEVEYLVFENEGHDVLKYENRVICYNKITDFFVSHLQSES